MGAVSLLGGEDPGVPAHPCRPTCPQIHVCDLGWRSDPRSRRTHSVPARCSPPLQQLMSMSSPLLPPSPEGAAPRSPREHGGFRPAKLTPPSSSAGLLAGEAEPARGPPSQPRPVHQGARLADCSRCLPRLRRLLPRVIAALRTGLAQPSKTDCALTPRVQMSVDAVAGTVSCSPVGLGGPGGPERLLLGTRVR